MSTLWLVRHGQTAGFGGGRYVDLTDRGRDQGRALGAWLASRPWVADEVWVGPRERHHQTWEAAGHALSGWPGPSEERGLDEHAGMTVYAEALRRRGEPPSPDPGLLLRDFRRAMRAWATGELQVDDVEDFPAFRERVDATLARLTAAPGHGRHVVAVTSAGFIGAAVASLLGGTSRHAVDLSFEVINASVTRVRFSGPLRTLSAFNTAPHLEEGVVTSI